MYGLPKNIDLSFLKGRRLDQICIGEHQVQFNFDERIRIYVHNSFDYTDADGIATSVQRAPAAAVIVNKLLGKQTSQINSHEDGTLEITFNAGEKLMFYDDNTAYECYEIRHGDEIIPV